jgi:peptidyl-prolyl cis-trans isomerase B (cyclophilin B)
MSFPRPSSRRVRPKGSAPRPGNQPPLDPARGGGPAGGPEPGSTPPVPGPPTGSAASGVGGPGPAPIRPGSRAANRAAKRASSGVRPKQVVRGRVSGRKNRGYSPALIGLAIGAVLIGGAVIALGNPFGSPSASASPSAGSSAGAIQSHGDGTCPASQPPPLAAGQSRLVTIVTELGDIVIRVDGALSPIAAGNFVALATCKFYDGIVFHRTPTLGDGTPFVIQGGDPEGTGGGGPGYTIADEPVTATYKRGTVAMARTQQPNSQGSQFFIVLDDKSADPLVAANTYAIFGEVVTGMEVADAIFDASEGEELPGDPIPMISVTVATAPAATASPAPASAAPSAAPTAAPTTAP